MEEITIKAQRCTAGWIQNEQRNTGREGFQEEVTFDL